ncbi:MAG: efflux RND transporter periplasmic adaptor subunit [Alphaproteobacteria bacterium]|nr:efflux RND transporter periplasmic adaptor subunit [Alphaproteobacteria bacterium]
MSLRWPFFLAAALFTGCMPTHAEGLEPPPTQVVRVAPVEVAEPVAPLTLQGVTRAADRARLALQVGGRLQERPVRVGDRVERGAVLARLDAAPWRNGVAAQVARVGELDERIAQLDRELGRLQRLEAKGSVVAVERERVQAERDAAASGSAALAVQLAETRRQLAESALHAPFAGVVVAVHAEPGETVAPGVPLIELAGEGVEVAVEVPEAAWVRLGDETPVRVRLPALGVETDGTVTDLAQAGGGRGGLFPVVVAVPPGEHRVAGLTAEVRFAMPVEAGLVAPIRAVVDPTGDAPAVFVVDEGRAHRQPVSLGALRGDAVVVEGVAPGAEVVVAGHAQLLDGQPVEVIRD